MLKREAALGQEEIAFYDALANNESAVRGFGYQPKVLMVGWQGKRRLMRAVRARGFEPWKCPSHGSDLWPALARC